MRAKVDDGLMWLGCFRRARTGKGKAYEAWERWVEAG